MAKHGVACGFRDWCDRRDGVFNSAFKYPDLDLRVESRHVRHDDGSGFAAGRTGAIDARQDRGDGAHGGQR